MIVWVASYPRSGNTFVRLVLARGFGIRSANAYRDPRLQERFDLNKRYPYHLGGLDPDELQRIKREGEPTFVKTHDLADGSDESPALYIVRDGRDALVSYGRFSVEWGEQGFEGMTPEEAMRVLLDREADSPFGGWSANVRSWTERSAPTTTLRFEDLVTSDDPVALVAGALADLRVSRDRIDEELPSFEQLQSLAKPMFRRGVVGAWRTEMPAEIEGRFWELHGEQMVALGYDRDHPS